MKVVRSVPLVVKTTVVWHLVLGLEHTLVRNTSPATVSKLIHETTRGSEPGHIIHTWLHSSTWIFIKQSSDFLIGCRSEVGIIESSGEGIYVGN